jgi:hypothetical protein
VLVPLARVAGAALDRAGDVMVATSAVVLPVALRVTGVAIGAARAVAVPLAERLGREPAAERETVVRTWPLGDQTPAGAHATATQDLAEAQAAGEVPVEGIEPADLPVPGWDGLTVAAARQRLRGLASDDVRLLLAYEQRHGARPAVLLTLERRLARDAGEGPKRTIRPRTRGGSG